jgi:glutamine synthetase
MLRFDLIEKAYAKVPVVVETPAERPVEYFAQKVFTRDKMKRFLSPETYAQMVAVMDREAVMDRSIADEVAEGMMRWAIELGVTHYTHWFHPLTGTTAEKHDSFIEPEPNGTLIERFSGSVLVQQEPDASSFPNGGIRATFEARGYSAWDPTSPAFVMGDTLCIPTIFIAFTGEALDYKAPLLRALHAVDKASVSVCRLFDPSVKRVTSYLGWEQEYFLVDEDLFRARQDLLLTGRTLVGHASAKDQQLGDHYLGAIPERVAAFMKDLQIEALKLGIPIKTCHNEVAPNQFEFAPIYEETNLACDHNMLLMTLMKKVALRHGLCCLLHEKPFKGVNGSGKHCNFSLQIADGDRRRNLMAPGHSEEDNLMFITFVVNTLAAVCRHNGLLKASIMNASNAGRLGGHEAPPAIISSFIGRGLSEVLDAIEQSDGLSPITMEGKHGHSLDIPQIPELMIDNTDRNRTSPFAFNGNRFEFRAVGSEANCARSMIVLNTAVAEQLTEFREHVDCRMNEGMTPREAVMTEVRKLIVASKAIRFDGNGYSEEWEQEARRRGLNCETSAPLVFDAYTADESVAMFERMGVMRRIELQARNEINWEMYVKKVQIESRVLCDMGENHVVPAALDYKGRLVDTIYKAGTFGGMVTDEKDLVEQISDCVSVIRSGISEMRQTRKRANALTDMRARAIAYHDDVIPLMTAVRKKIDKLEEIVDDSLWPLPKYRELLFAN